MTYILLQSMGFMRLFICVLLLFAVTGTVQARDLQGLYRAIVPVIDQSEAERRMALKLTLAQVIKKVTGREAVMNNIALATAFSRAESFVEQYQYKKTDDIDEEQEAPLIPEYLLSVLYNKASIDAVLKQHNVPVWGRNRPVVLAWVAIKTKQGERYLVGPERAISAGHIEQAGDNSGLPYTLPLMDLQDQRSVTFNDVWGGFSERILKASERYGVEHVLFSRFLQRPDGQWRARWSLLSDQGQVDGNAEQAVLVDTLAEMTSDTTKILADIYAPEGVRHRNSIIMKVDGIDDLAGLSHVFGYLQSLDVIVGVSWQHVQLNEVKFELTYEGELAVLRDTIKLNNILKEVTEGPELLSNAIITMTNSSAMTVYEPLLHYRVGF